MTKQWSIYYFFFKDFQDINKDEPNAVLVGLAPDQMNYEKLTTAFRLIKENKAPLIAINKSRYIQTKEGLSLGPGMKLTWIPCKDSRKGQRQLHIIVSNFSVVLGHHEILFA